MAAVRTRLRRVRVPGDDLRFFLLGSAVFFEAAGIGALYPLLAKIQQAHGLGDYALGLMSGGNFLAALLAQIGVSRFLDGARARRVLLAGLLLGSLALLWFAHAGNLSQLVASRALGGVAYGIVGPASLREAATGSIGEQRGRRLGILSSMMMAGIVIGPLIGSLLAAVGGIPLPFEVLAGLLALVFVAALALPGPRQTVAPVTTAARGDGRAPAPAPAPAPRLLSRTVLAVLLLAAAAQLPTGVYDALWSRLLTDRGATELLIGLSLSLFGLPFMVLAPLGGRLAERRGPLLAASVALIVSDGFMASYGFVPWPIIIVLLGIGEACAQCVAVPGGYAAVARAWPDDRAATGQGWFSGAGTAAAGAASLAGAPTYAALGPGAVFAGGAGISVLLALAGLVVAGSGRRALAAPAADQAAGPRGDAVAGLAADPVAGPAADAAAGPAADPVAGPAATPDAAARPAAGDARTRGRPVGAPPDRHLP